MTANPEQLLAEAIRVGSQSATMAAKYLQLLREAMREIDSSIRELERGRIKSAHDRLVETRQTIGGKLAIPKESAN